ncbi:hypothetical protein CRE_29250 [Caenorhabditis remanei]|uniref:F-box domain-containing protein n=1 Tax=Caenorhabditis remanei TaxID=31234 RepID=E3NM06_CAERE|nr:hypothetical protein CRE_29250 [Caenorhabditis remanei]
MPPLPLLRLPQLILREVFKSLSIIEKIKLSLCSKKMSQINISRLHSQKVILVLDILKQNIRVLSENNRDIFEIFTYPDSEIGQNSNISRGFQIFSKNHQEGCLSVTRNLLKMFQCKVTTNISCYNTDLYQPMVSMLLIRMWNSKSSLFPLKDQKMSSFFTSWQQKIGIINSAWFTLEHLLACTCTTITLGKSHLGSKDLDVMLRNWKAGGFPNLEYLLVDRDYISNNTTTIWKLNPSELRGNVIRTNDGTKKATINTSSGRIEMYVTPVE